VGCQLGLGAPIPPPRRAQVVFFPLASGDAGRMGPGDVRRAGRADGATTAPGCGVPGGNPLEQLDKLAKLHNSGALTDAEFEAEKRRILGG
jgi:hypothetical protein